MREQLNGQWLAFKAQTIIRYLPGIQTSAVHHSWGNEGYPFVEECSWCLATMDQHQAQSSIASIVQAQAQSVAKSAVLM